jgi:hypothetical protein
MADYITHDNLTFISTMEYQNPQLESSAISTIQAWVSSANSQLLRISENFTRKYPNAISNVAANFVQTAVDLRLPICGFFCRWPTDYPSDAISEKACACVVDLLCSLIRQAIELLPSQIDTKPHDILSMENFQVLEHPEQEGAWSMALNIFRNILIRQHAPLFIVLDGIEHLDDTYAAGPMADILSVDADVVIEQTSRSSNSPQRLDTESRQPLNVLFTTAGDCDTLSGIQMSLNEQCFERVVLHHTAKRFTVNIALGCKK